MELVDERGEIDLDAVATVRPEPEVVEAMRPWLSARHAHPDSTHAAGARARRAIEVARADVAALVGMPSDGIVFTSGATESNNLAIRGVIARALRSGPASIAVPAREHSSLLHPCRSLAAAGVRNERLSVGRDGLVALEALPLEPLSLLAFSHAHPELGALQSARFLVERARRVGAACLVDVSWTLGRIEADRASLGEPELMSFSFHRMGGPMGVGALAIREGLSLPPLFEGGTQEHGLRPGSPNLAGIVGAGVASRRALQTLADRRQRLARLGSLLSTGLLSIPGVHGSGPELERRLPGRVSVVVDGLDGDALVTALDARGVLFGNRLPCSQTAGLPSAALLAAGYGRDEASSAVVFCIPPVAGPDERAIAHAVRAVALEVERLARVAGRVARPEA